jgi:signal peptidase I
VSERNGYISINGRPLKEPYTKLGRRDNEARTWQVRQGDYFFLGDNRANSCDSREFGSVPRHNLVGPVVAIYRPLNRIGLP